MTDDETASAEKVGVAILYFIFGIISVVGLIFIYFYVPETKGKTPEEIMGIVRAKNGINYSPLLASASDRDSQKSFNV